MVHRSLARSTLGFAVVLFGIAGQITPTFAANDWNTPCFDGVCQYSLTAAPGQSGSGTMQIWGSQNALSDITSAAGWQILNCSSTEMAQDIRLVCMSSDTEAAGCDHVFQAGGAVGKIVRLPEDCGMSPFARVVNASVSEDQTLPDSMNTTAQVQALSLDVNFGAIDPSKAGNLSIAIQGANYPGADVNGTLVPTTTSRKRSRIEGRGGMTERGLLSFVGNAIDSIQSLNSSNGIDSININKTDNLPLINVEKSATILNKTISCGDVDLGVDLTVDGQANAQASIAVTAQGTIVPPALMDFQVTVGLDAFINGTADLNAGVESTFSTGEIGIFSIGIPGLDFPGILTIGPSFNVSVEADAVLDLAADLQVGLVYNISNAQLVFPPSSSAQSGGDFNLGDTPLSLSLSPSVAATGNFTAHLIPTLNLGISALDDVASANIFLNLDASATLVLGLQGSDDNSVTVDSSPSSSSSSSEGSSTTTSADSSSSDAVSYGYYYNTYYKRSSVVASAKPTSVVQAVSSAKRAAAYAYARSDNASTTSSSNAQFDGCIEIDVGLAVNAGAEGDFFDLFDDSTEVPLFNKEFVLFQKCFGDASISSLESLTAPPADGSSSTDASSSNSTSAAALTCLANAVGAPASIVEGATIAGKVVEAGDPASA
ncbi:hypothetical protein BT96DRAFT_871648 [Gymnopus androsaceus JB14]|uniref:DUF7223 domain-containing protein n=1 Tax=Gymnopus androsaceus JB14 TaxID=1447944 RepID=A0A6A4IGW8_9AGAR|nr:hypothetical protein BT96DRAFT_871648 [Gymnopus androsaceus JB14]